MARPIYRYSHLLRFHKGSGAPNLVVLVKPGPHDLDLAFFTKPDDSGVIAPTIPEISRPPIPGLSRPPVPELCRPPIPELFRPPVVAA